MGIKFGSRKALEVLVKDKVHGRFGCTEWGGHDFDAPDVTDDYFDGRTVFGAEPIDLDTDFYAEERQRMEEVKDKLTAAYTGTYDEKYQPSGAPKKKRSAALEVAQRRRAIRRVEAQPAFKGDLEPHQSPPTLPTELTQKGYRLHRNDEGFYGARGRGRHVRSGPTVETVEEVIEWAEADLAERGDPAPTRSKKGQAAQDAGEFDQHFVAGHTIEELAAMAGETAEAPEWDFEDTRANLAALVKASQEDEPEDEEPSPEELDAIEEVEQEARLEDIERAVIAQAQEIAPADPTEAGRATSLQVAGTLGRFTSPQLVARDLLRTDGDTQSREAMDYEAIQEYVEAMHGYGGWGDFPPVKAVYDGAFYWVFDGHQRLASHKLYAPDNTGDPIPVFLQPGDRRLAVLLSTGVNSDHGVRRSRADKQKAVTKLLKDDEWRLWSDAEIARHTNVDPKTVGNIRHRLEDNREIPDTLIRKRADGTTVNTANVGANQPSYVPVWQLEGMVNGWLSRFINTDPDLVLDTIHVNRLSANRGADDWGRKLMDSLTASGVKYRTGDLWQAVSNVREQRQQAQRQAKAREVYTGEPKAPAIDSAPDAPRSSLGYLPESERVEIDDPELRMAGFHLIHSNDGQYDTYCYWWARYDGTNAGPQRATQELAIEDAKRAFAEFHAPPAPADDPVMTTRDDAPSSTEPPAQDAAPIESPKLPAEMEAAGYKLIAAGNPPGTMWEWEYRSKTDPSDWAIGNRLYDPHQCIDDAVGDWLERRPGDEYTPTEETPDPRASLAQGYLALYRATLASLPDLTTLTGHYRNADFRNALLPAIHDLKSLLSLLGVEDEGK